jgi:hypothetical protein
MSQPLHTRAASAAQHPSLSSLSDFDAALALSGIRPTPSNQRMRSVSIPGVRFGPAAGRARRTRRRSAWLTGDHGTATLLGAHRSASGEPAESPPAA